MGVDGWLSKSAARMDKNCNILNGNCKMLKKNTGEVRAHKEDENVGLGGG